MKKFVRRIVASLPKPFSAYNATLSRDTRSKLTAGIPDVFGVGERTLHRHMRRA